MGQATGEGAGEIDDERLAALLDGRTGAAEREGMLARLAAADDDYHAFADAARILSEMEEDAARATRCAPPAGQPGGE